MSLQRRLVAVMSILLVVGLLVADVVTYVSVRSFLYGRADDTLASSEALAFNYVAYATERKTPLSAGRPVAPRLARRVRAHHRPRGQGGHEPALGLADQARPAATALRLGPGAATLRTSRAGSSAAMPGPSVPTRTRSSSGASGTRTGATGWWP